jgi:hypothetical protein
MHHKIFTIFENSFSEGINVETNGKNGRHRLQADTLSQHVELIQTNFHAIRSRFPTLYLAAESLKDIFDQLYTERIIRKGNESWEQEMIRMTFGLYSSWVYSFILTTAGLGELGLMSIRRSVEFTCYISKIKSSSRRAELWITKNDSIEERKQFAREFSIPNAYFGEKYSHLKPLLVLHDYASGYGAHANFSSISTKWRTKNTKSDFSMSFQDDPDRIPLSAGTTVLLGNLMLDSLMHDIPSQIRGFDEFHKRITTVKEIVTKARIEVASLEWKGNIPPEILQSIDSDENDLFSIDSQN